MTVLAHIDALHGKHALLEASIRAEQSRPLPDFTSIAELKKRKLQVKQELSSLESADLRRRQA